MTTLKLIGIYRVPVSEEEFRFIKDKVTQNLEDAQEAVDGLALLEVEIRGAPNDFDIGLLHQEWTGQVPYDERYFTGDGSQLLGSERPDQPDFRVCFFLHYFEPSTAITSPYGDILPTGLTDMPERLAAVCVYTHPG